MDKYQMIIIMVYLLSMSIMDLKVKKISYTASILCILGIICCYIVKGKVADMYLLSGTLLGLGIIFLSKLTSGAIGIGDGIVFCLTGSVLGVIQNFSLLCISLLLAGAASIFLLCIHKLKKKDKIPFVPFVFLAFGGMIYYGL